MRDIGDANSSRPFPSAQRRIGRQFRPHHEVETEMFPGIAQGVHSTTRGQLLIRKETQNRAS